MKSASPCKLYAHSLGDAWRELAPPVRSLHSAEGETRGRFVVMHGRRWIARRLAKASRLPRATKCAETRLRIVTEGESQRWERQFDGEQLVTTQWAGDDGCLMERIRAWELTFRLRVEDGALHYEQQRARLCVGPLRVWLPWTPVVSAAERPDGPTRVRVSVNVRLPFIGRLIAYDGWLDVEEVS
jgi:hypothetical protein